MKQITLVVFLLTLMQSCGSKHVGSTSDFVRDHKIVLGAFYDEVRPSTLNLDELIDLPRRVDVSDVMTEVKNQGDRGTCSFFSTTALYEAAVKKDRGVEVNFSEEYLNFQAKTQYNYFKNSEASNLFINFFTQQNYGMLFEEDMPYGPLWFEKGFPCAKFESTDESAPQNCFSHNPPNSNSLKKVIPGDAFHVIQLENNTNSIIKYLHEYHLPVGMGLNYNEHGWPRSGDVFYNEDLRQECLSDESICGGHFVVITGYDLDKKIFFIKNSWGVEWGNKGYGTVTFETVDRYAYSDEFLVVYETTDKLVLPKMTKLENNKIEVKKFVVRAQTRKDNSVSLAVNADIIGAKSSSLIVSHLLVKQDLSQGKAIPSDENTEALKWQRPNGVEDYAYTKEFFSSLTSTDNLSWDAKAPLRSMLAVEQMNHPEVISLMQSKEAHPIIRSTIYSYGDTGMKILARVFSEIK